MRNSTKVLVSSIFYLASVGAAGAAGAVSAVLAPRKASDIQTVQATSNFPHECVGGIEFDRLVTPPTVTPFVIPSGKIYVVTSIDWSVRGSVANQLREINFLVAVGDSVNGSSGGGVSLADASGRWGGSVQFPTGIVVRANERLCVAVFDESQSHIEAIAHGFLAADR